MMKTKVVNLLGGSGLGKSTTAALVYGELKLMNYEAELVREYVKEWAIQKKPVGPFGQSVIYGHQVQRETDLYGKVEFIVTDSPLILCCVYQKFYEGVATIEPAVHKDLVQAKQMNIEHINILLSRVKPFNPVGRYETEEQAIQIDKATESYLVEHNIPFVRVTDSDRERVSKIIDLITKEDL